MTRSTRMARNTRDTRIAWCLVALLLMALPLSAAKKEPHPQRIYMFGFAMSLTDSVAYQTDIQTIDSAWIEPAHKFLVDRALYSLQLQYHVETDEHHKNTVCTVYFNTSPRKLQRKWAKVRKRHEKDPIIRYHILPSDRFSFKAEEYRPVIMEEPTAVSDSTQTQTAAKPAPVPAKGKKTKKNSKP